MAKFGVQEIDNVLIICSGRACYRQYRVYLAYQDYLISCVGNYTLEKAQEKAKELAKKYNITITDKSNKVMY